MTSPKAEIARLVNEYRQARQNEQDASRVLESAGEKVYGAETRLRTAMFHHYPGRAVIHEAKRYVVRDDRLVVQECSDVILEDDQ